MIKPPSPPTSGPEHRPDGPDESQVPLVFLPFAWPFLVTSAMSHATAAMLGWYTRLSHGATEGDPPPAPDWTTPNRVLLDLPTMRLRDFSGGGAGQPVLICAPFALHRATIADFAPGHSVVGALRSVLPRVLVTDWRSAEPAMQFFSIDTYLADLAIAIEEIGPPVDLVGLCQGGWMAMVFAARFPEKVRRLVLAGAPIDVRAAESSLTRAVDTLPSGAFEDLVRLGAGRVLGRHALRLWRPAPAAIEPDNVLQLSAADRTSQRDDLERRFALWYAATVDLPGTYYLDVVQRLFRDNQIAEGRFVALGRAANLRNVRAPMYLLAAGDDEVVAPAQLFAAAQRAGTPAQLVVTKTVACGHLGLFMGARTIAGAWHEIARWLARDLDLALAS